MEVEGPQSHGHSLWTLPLAFGPWGGGSRKWPETARERPSVGSSPGQFVKPGRVFPRLKSNLWNLNQNMPTQGLLPAGGTEREAVRGPFFIT